MNPYIQDADFTLYVGDVREVLATLPDGSVDCCVTSPPYWGLRDYGHDGQIGLEATPELFVAEMVAVFAEVRRVLSDTGTCWLNLGDSYVANAANNQVPQTKAHIGSGLAGPNRNGMTGLEPKNLVGIPWRVALALQADGWYLRSDIIWSKPNPMPESVTDRPTKAHEYVFLLTKSARYFFDQEAVREPYAPDGRNVTTVVGGDGSIQHRDGERWPNGGRNIRSVWEIATQPYADAHFAVFPEALPERCIKAGCPEQVCRVCGEPRPRIVERGESDYSRLKGDRDWRDLAEISAAQGKGVRPGQSENRPSHANHTMTERGTVPSLKARAVVDIFWGDCSCPPPSDSNIEQGVATRTSSGGERSSFEKYRTGIVLDPFMGSGTTALVARKLGRVSIGIELNPEYADLCGRRLQQQSLFA